MSDKNTQAEEHWWNALASSLEELPASDEKAYAAARARQDTLTKPQGALGRLEDFACWLAAWQGRKKPQIDQAEALVFAGNHGVTAQGVSPYPSSVTAQMVKNFQNGGAAICQLCETYGAKLSVIALDLDNPTADMTLEPAVSVKRFEDFFARGRAAVPKSANILLLGEMGIGNTTTAAALSCALIGGSPAFWTGPGTGLDAHGVTQKTDVVARALKLHTKHCVHPFETLRRVGGYELVAIAGAILEARKCRIPVLLDGYVCGAAALVLEKTKTGALDHCLAGHLSAEPAHRRLLKCLGKEPVVELGMRLGEGTGAAIALGVLRGAVAAHNGMATFAEAHVDGRE